LFLFFCFYKKQNLKSKAFGFTMQAKQTPLTCSGHTRPVVDLSFSSVTPEGIFLISACKDGNPMLRNGQTGDWIGTFLGHKGAVWSTCLNSTATKAVTGSADFSAKLWDARTGDEISSYAHNHIVRAVAYSNDEHVIVTGGHEKKIRIFNLEKKADPTILEGHTGVIKSIVLDSQNTIFSSGDDKEIRIWDPRTKTQVQKCPLDDPVSSMELTLDGKYLISTSGKKITFWELSTLQKYKEYTVPYEVDTASLHPTENRFVAGGSDFYIHIYEFDNNSNNNSNGGGGSSEEDINRSNNSGINISNPKELEVYKGHHGPVHCIRFSPDGEVYASGSEDGTIRLWQTKPGAVYGLWQGIANGKDETDDHQ